MSTTKALLNSALATVVGAVCIAAGLAAIYGGGWLFVRTIIGVGSATCEAAVAWLPLVTDTPPSGCSPPTEGINFGVGAFACMFLVGCYGLGKNILGWPSEKRAEAEAKRQHAERMHGYRDQVRHERAEAEQSFNEEKGA